VSEKVSNFIRQYGLQRSGTCYTQFLFEQNFDVKVLNREPDKHTPLGAPPHVPSVLSVKHPFSWAVSIFKYYKKQSKDVAKFKSFCISAAIPLWNRRMAQFLAMKLGDQTLAIIRAEDLLDNSKKVIGKAAKEFGLTRTSKKWITSNKIMRPIHGGEESARKFDRTKYTKKKWMEAYNKKLLKRAIQTVDQRLMRVFGYKNTGDF